MAERHVVGDEVWSAGLLGGRCFLTARGSRDFSALTWGQKQNISASEHSLSDT